jgi:hypothetical protein
MLPLGLGSSDSPVLPQQFIDLEVASGLRRSSAMDHSKVAHAQIIASENTYAQFSRMDATFKIPKQCSALGVCRKDVGDRLPSVLALHASMQRAMLQVLDKEALQSGDALLLFQGVDRARGLTYHMYSLTCLQWFQQPTFSVFLFLHKASEDEGNPNAPLWIIFPGIAQDIHSLDAGPEVSDSTIKDRWAN